LETAVLNRTGAANEDLVFESSENEKKRKNYQNKQRIRSLCFVSSHDLQEPLRQDRIPAESYPIPEKLFLRIEDAAERMNID
jgi:hypothetical protein